MGRAGLLLWGGLLLVVVGACGTVAGLVWGGVGLTTGILNATTASDDELCNADERLVEVAGPSEYTALEGSRRSVRYYCQTEDGARREVTGAFVEGMVGEAVGAGAQFIGATVLSVACSTAFTVGLVMAIIGLVVRRRAVPG